MFQNSISHSGSSEDFPLEGLRLITTCPICSTQYNLTKAKIVDEQEGAHLIHITCKKCHSSIVALVLVGGLGVSSVGLICDLTPEDVSKFKNSDTVNTDDVIDIHQILENDKLVPAIADN
ncbi:hypothetical protein KKI23_02490 [Patescibacteria group bacterium]|nr:hypothetical protein [Patescibacteria group bacterium]